MISGGNLGNETVNRPDFHVGPDTLGSLCKDGAGRVRVGQNENPFTVISGDFPYIVGALVCFPTTRGRFHDDKPSI
jgi:hypothetical protein